MLPSTQCDTAPRLAGRDPTDDHDPAVDALVSRAVAAQRSFATWPEAQVDALLHDIAKCIAEHAEELAVATVAETGFGNVPDKILKNRLASQMVYQSLAGKPATGLLRMDAETGIADFASPVGVVFGVLPKTNPVATFVFKVLIALKARNAVILSCHRDAQRVGQRTGDLITAVLKQHATPAGLVQWNQRRADRRTTLQLMRHPDVAFILATGAAGVVRAAYSSGTPAIGVGAGNAPTWVCADADLDQVAQAVVASKSFDNGIMCASEHNLVVDGAIRPAFLEALEWHGAAVLREYEIDRFVAAVFESGDDAHVRSELLGQSAPRLLEAAGLNRAGAVRLVVVPARRHQITGPLGREKLAPVTSLFTVDGDEEGFAICHSLLANEGAGHTAIIHSADSERIARFGREMPASRILVNAPGAQGTLGMESGLPPSLTVGCGTFGGTSTTDNVTFTHLLNIKRLAYRTLPVRAAA
ncbi:MAG: aldehyde dehydrogenase family protein [Chloroflexi bacterium]|nr:aldehyde dehydrogenase family protein [Chloroflexota bacterium]